MGIRVSSRRFVGREEELDRLLRLADRASVGDGGAALVLGGAGIGKSRLVSEFARAARDRDILTLIGECVDLAEADLPYAPIVEGAFRDRATEVLHEAARKAGCMRHVLLTREIAALARRSRIPLASSGTLEAGAPAWFGLTARETEVPSCSEPGSRSRTCCGEP